MSPGRRYDPDEIALLEEERNFLLRSLDDLERERTEGNIDPDDYRRLHDDYTARAAAVLRSIRDGVDARPEPPPASTRRRVFTIGGIVAFALVAAVLLGGTLGERLPGQTATGNQQLRGDAAPADTSPADAATTDLETLKADVDDDPDDVGARVTYGDALLGDGQAAEALRQYDAAAELAPGNARARASGAFLVFQAGLVEDALERLDAAEAADPTYPDTYFFRGIVLLRGQGDGEAAEAAFTRYLELAPDGLYAADVEVILEQIRQDQTADDEGE